MCEAKTKWLMTLTLLVSFALVEKGKRKRGEGKIYFFLILKAVKWGPFIFLKFFRILLRGIHVFHHIFRGILKNILIKQVAVISEAVC